MERLGELKKGLEEAVSFCNNQKEELINILNQMSFQIGDAVKLHKKKHPDSTETPIVQIRSGMDTFGYFKVVDGRVKKVIRYEGNLRYRGEQSVKDYVNSLNPEQLANLTGELVYVMEVLKTDLDYKFNIN